LLIIISIWGLEFPIIFLYKSVNFLFDISEIFISKFLNPFFRKIWANSLTITYDGMPCENIRGKRAEKLTFFAPKNPNFELSYLFEAKI